jgi:hypothetical protein
MPRSACSVALETYHGASEDNQFLSKSLFFSYVPEPDSSTAILETMQCLLLSFSAVNGDRLIISIKINGWTIPCVFTSGVESKEV